jgi:hypothetical protein
MIRGQATEALTAILKSTIECDLKESHSTSSRCERVFDILKAMITLHWIDMQRASLLTTKAIIELSGQHLSSHVWRAIISLIKQFVIDANQSKYADVVKIGFQILQLISNEFLTNFDAYGLAQCIESIGIYGSIVQDLNINLGAIGLLWNVADYLHLRSRNSKSDGWDLKMIDSLYVDLLSQLAKLCENGHPDVRNGAAHTLFRTFTIYGWAFQRQTLRSSFDQIMYPLMEMVMGPCPEIATGEVVQKGEETDVQGDKDIRLSVHHSKESLQKQWEETQVLVVSGIAKIFEEYMVQLIDFEDILDPWSVYMALVASLIRSGCKEVIAGTMEAYCSLLNMTSVKSEIDGRRELIPLWRKAFAIWKSISQAVFVEKTQPYDWTQKIIVSFLLCFRGIYALLHSELVESDFRDVFAVFDPCIFVQSPDAFRDDVNMTPVQKTIIELLDAIEITESRVSLMLHYHLQLCYIPFSKEQHLHRTNAAHEAICDSSYTFFALSRTCIQHVPLIFIDYSNGTSLYLDGTFQRCIKVRRRFMTRCSTRH